MRFPSLLLCNSAMYLQAGEYGTNIFVIRVACELTITNIFVLRTGQNNEIDKYFRFLRYLREYLQRLYVSGNNDVRYCGRGINSYEK